MTLTMPLPAGPIRIHHIEGRRSFRVIWLCEELGLPYRLEFERGDVMGSVARLRTAYPLMPIAPVVHIDDVTMMESGAVLQVLTARYGNGRLAPPVDSPDYPRHAQWMHFAEGTLLARLTQHRFMALAAGAPLAAMPKGYRSGIDPLDAPMSAGPEQVFRFVEDDLSRHAYFGGAGFSSADIMMHYALRSAKLLVAIDTASYPAIDAWRQTVERRPAYARTVAAALPDGMNEYLLPQGQPLPFPPA